jgi:hypothetical protein
MGFMLVLMVETDLLHIKVFLMASRYHWVNIGLGYVADFLCTSYFTTMLLFDAMSEDLIHIKPNQNTACP